MQPCNDSYVSELHWWRARPKTSGDWIHKYGKTALCSLPSFCIEHSLLFTFSYRNFVFVIHLSWHILTARDDARDRDANSSRQMTSLDAIFCRGNKSSSRSLARCCEKSELDLWASLTINKYFEKMTHFRNAASSHSGLIPLKTAGKKKRRITYDDRDLKNNFINLQSATFVTVLARNLVKNNLSRLLKM